MRDKGKIIEDQFKYHKSFKSIKVHGMTATINLHNTYPGIVFSIEPYLHMSYYGVPVSIIQS